MGVTESHAKLAFAARALFVLWDKTSMYWQDENRRRFEKRYLDRLRSELRKSELAMEHMDAVLNHIRQDCQ